MRRFIKNTMLHANVMQSSERIIHRNPHISNQVIATQMERNISLNITDSYWDLLKNLNKDIKLKLIAKLTDSLLNEEKTKAPANLADKYYGAWKDDSSAEELIDKIRDSRILGTRQIASFE